LLRSQGAFFAVAREPSGDAVDGAR